jgi:hypothetical protein
VNLGRNAPAVLSVAEETASSSSRQPSKTGVVWRGNGASKMQHSETDVAGLAAEERQMQGAVEDDSL